MIHGYRHPELDAAMHAQIDTFSHVMFGGLTHAGAVELATTLARLTPGDLNRVFLADSGSVGVEVALKLARQVQLARRRPERTQVAALRGGYHGDTLGAMSVCDPVTGMHAAFGGSVPEQIFLPRPPRFHADDAEVAAWLAEARQIVIGHRDRLAAIIVEPILQGAGGMWSWSPTALAGLRLVADEFDLLLIADEVATGFGRTGHLFACEWADVVPDIMVVGKSMTGGYLTQAATLASDALAEELDISEFGALMHGPTFMANPLACAASLASIALVETGTWRSDVARIETLLSATLADLVDHPGVREVRVLGGAAAIELTTPVDVAAVGRLGVEHGVWLRPFGTLVYAMPPYVCSDADLHQIAGAMRTVATSGASA